MTPPAEDITPDPAPPTRPAGFGAGSPGASRPGAPRPGTPQPGAPQPGAPRPGETAGSRGSGGRETRLVLAEGDALVRESLTAALDGSGLVRVMCAVGDAEAAMADAERLGPAAILLSTNVSGRQTFDVAGVLRVRLPDLGVVILASSASDGAISDALRVGALGIVSRQDPLAALLDAVSAAARGERSVGPSVRARLVDGSGRDRDEGPRTRSSLLSPREREVLRYIASGMSKKDIAGVMHISVKTVDNHSTSLMAKLDLHNRVELTRFAIREGLARV